MSRLPDFIIIGAMKCGTTSVHHLLDAHPGVFLPPGEVYFFDVDDPAVHADFFADPVGHPEQHDFERDRALYLRWYERHFQAAGAQQVVGEDSTTYLSSARVPARLQAMIPGVKLIAMLRDPVARAYSHYWHNVTRGRAVLTFEETLRRDPANYLERGHYAEQLRRFAHFLERGQLRVIFYEDFVRAKQATIDDLLAYLGISGSVDVAAHDAHQNPARAPLHLKSRLLANRVYRRLTRTAVMRNLPNMPGYDERAPLPQSSARRPGWLGALASLNARLPPRPYPPLRDETRGLLQDHFRRENADLAKILQQDVAARWPYMG